MGDPALTPRERFTYRQYRTWPDEERWELIEGVAYSMSPAPLTVHQLVTGRLFAALTEFLEGAPCQAFIAPFDVLLPAGDESDDQVDCVVQPDVLVYCDKSKITRRGGRGAPDFVAEVLSPRTAKKDLGPKFDLYEKRGVRELWVLDAGEKVVHAWSLGANGRFGEDRLTEEGELASTAIEGFSVDLGKLFRDLG
jgi:Uma2 family endonuclease